MSTILITGGHAGIGFECAKVLASGSRHSLILAGRDRGRIEAAAGRLHAQYGAKVETVVLDLGSLSSVRAAARTCRSMIESGQIDPLAAILCNAGVQFLGQASYSTDGYEETFAVNCLGHFLLLNLLLDRVAPGGRIVFTASGTHDPETMDGKSIGAAVEPDANALASEGKSRKPISGGKRYSTSKLCTMLYAYELDRRLRQAQIPASSIAYDPGFVPETGLGRTAPAFLRWLVRTSLMKALLRQFGVTMGSLSFSGKALAKIAVDPAFADVSGKYFHSNNGALVEARSSKASYDQAKAAKLWRDSEQLVHLEPSERPMRLQQR